jgi:hypothetical protein
MTLDASGNLLVGTGTSGGGYGNFNSASNKQNLWLKNELDTGWDGSSCHVVMQYSAGTPNNASCYFMYAADATAARFQVFSNGTVENATGSYGTISDIKLKENVLDATPKLSDLMNVRIVNYNLKSDPDQKYIGVIAQELEQIFPGLVYESTDRDMEGNELGTTTKAVKYSIFVPMLIKAIQEQQAIIEGQDARIQSLEARLTAAGL